MRHFLSLLCLLVAARFQLSDFPPAAHNGGVNGEPALKKLVGCSLIGLSRMNLAAFGFGVGWMSLTLNGIARALGSDAVARGSVDIGVATGRPERRLPTGGANKVVFCPQCGQPTAMPMP